MAKGIKRKSSGSGSGSGGGHDHKKQQERWSSSKNANTETRRRRHSKFRKDHAGVDRRRQSLNDGERRNGRDTTSPAKEVSNMNCDLRRKCSPTQKFIEAKQPPSSTFAKNSKNGRDGVELRRVKPRSLQELERSLCTKNASSVSNGRNTTSPRKRCFISASVKNSIRDFIAPDRKVKRSRRNEFLLTETMNTSNSRGRDDDFNKLNNMAMDEQIRTKNASAEKLRKDSHQIGKDIANTSNQLKTNFAKTNFAKVETLQLNAVEKKPYTVNFEVTQKELIHSRTNVNEKTAKKTNEAKTESKNATMLTNEISTPQVNKKRFSFADLDKHVQASTQQKQQQQQQQQQKSNSTSSSDEKVIAINATEQEKIAKETSISVELNEANPQCIDEIEKCKGAQKTQLETVNVPSSPVIKMKKIDQQNHVANDKKNLDLAIETKQKAAQKPERTEDKLPHKDVGDYIGPKEQQIHDQKTHTVADVNKSKYDCTESESRNSKSPYTDSSSTCRVYDDLDQKQVQLDVPDDQINVENVNQGQIRDVNDSITVTPTKFPISIGTGVKSTPTFSSSNPISNQVFDDKPPCSVNIATELNNIATVPKIENKEVKQDLKASSAQELKQNVRKHNPIQDFQQVIIPPDLRSFKLMSEHQYITYTKSICATESTDEVVESLAEKNTVLHMLLDSMGFELSKPFQSQESFPSPITLKEKKSTETYTSVRDFIISLIDQIHQPAAATNLLRLTAYSFRLAAHSLLLACQPSNSDDRKSKQSKSKHLKRSLLTLFICLRGLFAHVMDTIKETNENEIQTSNETVSLQLKSYFLSHDSLSEAELLLLDVVPLLTDLDRKHGTLGSKKSISLFKHLVKLKEAFISLVKAEDPECNVSSKSSINGINEMFMRQLLHQERNDSELLLRELKKCQKKVPLTGTMACTLVSMTSSCSMVIDKVVTYRENLIQTLKSKTPKCQDQKKFVKVTPATAASTSEYNYSEDSIWYDQKTETDKIRYDELRIDGCIYISQILDVLRSMEEEKEIKRLKLSRVVYFLFHILWENDPFPGGVVHAKSLQNRENMKSAALACFMLAGKVLDEPVSIKLLLLVSKGLFPFPSMVVSTAITENNFGEPSKNLIKEYESHILFRGFGFVAPKYEEINEAEEILLKADIDKVIREEDKRMFNHPAFTHSQLSLIEDATTVAHAIHLSSCQLHGRSPSSWFQALCREDQENAERLSSYMESVFSYVKERRSILLNITSTTKVLVPKVMKAPDFESVLNELNYCADERCLSDPK